MKEDYLEMEGGIVDNFTKAGYLHSAFSLRSSRTSITRAIVHVLRTTELVSVQINTSHHLDILPPRKKVRCSRIRSTATPTASCVSPGEMGTTSQMQAYGESWYWDNRYAGDSRPFDWYQKYSSLSPLVRLYVSPPDRCRVLVVGCGNSLFSEQMVDDGYEDVVNVDVSSVVIDEMKRKYADRPQLQYRVMDVRDMTAFESASFDAVIDKGTLDSLLCGSNSRKNAEKMLEEVGRVLKDKGAYILITYGSPTYRLQLLRQINLWTIKLHVIEKFTLDGNSHHQWELTKPVPLDSDGSTVEASLGNNPDVHYIYVCSKVQSLEHE